MAGFGGQGIMVMGQVLATAAMLEEKSVVWHPSYGPEMRGGTAYCTVVISDQEIGSPIVSEFDSALILDQPSLPKFQETVKPGGHLFLNISLISEEPNRNDIQVVKIPANHIAEQVGDVRVANLAMLGALVQVTGLVSPDSIPQALRRVIPQRRHNLIPINQKAFEEGARSAKS